MTYHTPEQARAFWVSLDERSKLELAKTAPKFATRCAWEQMPLPERSCEFFDYYTHVNYQEGDVYVFDDGAWEIVESGEAVARGKEADVESAKSAVDTRLREMGFVLEDRE